MDPRTSELVYLPSALWKLLREFGVDGAVEQIEKRLAGISPLRAAVEGGRCFVVQLLLRWGAEVDAEALRRLAIDFDQNCTGPLPTSLARSQPVLHPKSGSSRTASWIPRSPLTAKTFKAVDIAPFVHPELYDDAARLESAKSWDESFCTVGFGLIEGHDVPQQLMDDFRVAAKVFFAGPSHQKGKFYHGATMTGKSGYSPIKDGTSQGGHSDPVEGYTFIRPQVAGATNGWNCSDEKHPEELNGIGQLYAMEVERVMHALHRMSAVALGVDIDFFEPYYTKPASVLVVSNYPSAQAAKVPDGKLRYRAHSDYSGFTVLLQDESDFAPGGFGGLEIDLGGKWVPVKPQRGTLVINIGDLFELWTNDRWRSTPHRVVGPVPRSPGASSNRLTAMLFSGPNLDSLISPIESCVDAQNPSRYRTMSAAEHMKTMWKTKSKESRYKEKS